MLKPQPPRTAQIVAVVLLAFVGGCDLNRGDAGIGKTGEPAKALQSAPAALEGCISLSDEARVSLAGTVSTQPYALPGEEPAASARTAFVLTLDAPACFDGGEATEGMDAVERVQLLPVDSEVAAALAAAAGRRIVAQGDAVEAHSAHHRSAVVLLVDRISEEGTEGSAEATKR
jgi:hypothetical protein